MLVAAVATVFTLVTLSGVAKLEKRFFPQGQTHSLTIVLEKPESLVTVLEQIHLDPQATVRGIAIVSKAPEYTLEIKVRGESRRIIQEVLALEGVRNAAIE
jgi:uncharacterized membrane protein YhiD involved in acid resistance